MDELKRAVFESRTPWDAIGEIFDTLYPDVRRRVEEQCPDLTEAEPKDFMLSFFNVSRQDEADMFGTTVHSVDKLRNGVRKKLREAHFEG